MFAFVRWFKGFKKKDTALWHLSRLLASMLKEPLDDPLRRVATVCSDGDQLTRFFCLTSTKIMPPLKGTRDSAVFIDVSASS